MPMGEDPAPVSANTADNTSVGLVNSAYTMKEAYPSNVPSGSNVSSGVGVSAP